MYHLWLSNGFWVQERPAASWSESTFTTRWGGLLLSTCRLSLLPRGRTRTNSERQPQETPGITALWYCIAQYMLWSPCSSLWTINAAWVLYFCFSDRKLSSWKSFNASRSFLPTSLTQSFGKADRRRWPQYCRDIIRRRFFEERMNLLCIYKLKPQI